MTFFKLNVLKHYIIHIYMTVCFDFNESFFCMELLITLLLFKPIICVIIKWFFFRFQSISYYLKILKKYVKYVFIHMKATRRPVCVCVMIENSKKTFLNLYAFYTIVNVIALLSLIHILKTTSYLNNTFSNHLFVRLL